MAVEPSLMPLRTAAAYLRMSRSGVRHAIISGRLEATVRDHQYFLKAADVERVRRGRWW